MPGGSGSLGKGSLGNPLLRGCGHVGGGGPQVPPLRGCGHDPPRGKSTATPASLAEGALVSCRGEEVEAPSSDEDEDGFQKPQVGAGLWGHGPPLSSRLLGKHKTFTDGLGLCSPGRWAPQRRLCAKERPSLGFAEQLGKEYTKLLNQSLDLRQVALQLAVGKLEKSPFCDELVQEGRELLFCALEFAGTKLPVRSRPDGQPFYLAAIEELLRISGDPDHRAFYSSSVSFAHGVRVGFKSKTPRVPAVFDKKKNQVEKIGGGRM